MMLRQDDKVLNPINAWGCYFMCFLETDSFVSGHIYDASEILKLWFKNWNEDDIDIESAVKDPQGLLDDLHAHLVYVGKKPKDYVCNPNEIAIQEMYNPRTKFIHFVTPRYDPLGHSVTAKEGYVISQRVIRRP